MLALTCLPAVLAAFNDVKAPSDYRNDLAPGLVDTGAAADDPPGPFGKSVPSPGTTDQSTSPVLNWIPSPNATSYEYCYDTVDNNACDSAWISAGSSTSVRLGGLNANTTYYWQVRANNESGTTYATEPFWSFTTYVVFPFSKAGPQHGATRQSRSPTLTWSASANATSYEYCYDTIDNDRCDSSWISAGSSTSVTLGELPQATVYYWQVFARNDAGVRFADAGSCCEWWNFTTRFVFSEDPLVSRGTGIRAAHILEMRNHVNVLLLRSGLPAYPWAERTLAGAVVKGSHLSELRSALADVYWRRYRYYGPTYTDPVITPGVTPVKAVHIAELRAAILALECRTRPAPGPVGCER